ncbi:hypothetical protein B0H10DRAFT_2214583 [Mycena sp. CBHHK59/15]|nr:hypothetical protein B0H10DRAFT_2214583 [Mycena sp. CBHHK59/15]
MDTENTFKKSEWIGKQRSWAIAPPALKKIAAQWFLIPQEPEHNLLPSPYLPIAQMLEFPLPLQNVAPVTTDQPAQFFSINIPDISGEALMLHVRRLPIPDMKTINKLLASSRQSWLDGTQSVIYSHLGGSVTHFPLWVLTYWAAVGDIKDAWGCWRASQAWVNHQKKISAVNPTHAALAEDATLTLAMLPWGLAKRGVSDSEPFHTLSQLLGPNWLAG